MTQMATVRYLFNFGQKDIIVFLAGLMVMPATIALLKLAMLWVDWFRSPFVLPLFNIGVYAVAYRQVHAYLKEYILCADDIEGKTDSFRRLVDDRVSSSSLQVYTQVSLLILFPMLVAFITESLVQTGFKLFMLMQAFKSTDESKCVVSLIFYSAKLAGIGLTAVGWMRNTYLMLVKLICQMILLALLASNNILEKRFLMQHQAAWALWVVLFGLLSGSNLSAAFIEGMNLTGEKAKRNAGLLMFLSLMLGVVYSQVVANISFFN